jgi:diguanylate cyclase (GGDEF)-like protein
MKHGFYDSKKILYMLISILILIQFGAFSVQIISNRKIAKETVNEELTLGAHVFYRLLESRHQHLKQTAEVLVRDYGFIESIATAGSDALTIESMLKNHGERASASLIILSDVNKSIIASVPPKIGDDSQSFVSNFNQQSTMHFASFTLTENEQQRKQLFHIINSAVRAPIHIADLTMGYEIGEDFVRDLHDLTDMDFFFISKHNNSWVTHASTLPTDLVSAFVRQFAPTKINKNIEISANDGVYMMLAVPISAVSGQDIFAVVAKPLNKAMRPYQRSEGFLGYLLIITIFLSMVAIYFVTKKMVFPLSEQANIDNLTGLGNRRIFLMVFNRALQNLQKSGTPFALLLLDLNRFKHINDTLGHDVGDLVLKTTAERLKHTLRNSDNVMRFGGDEFAILVEDCSEETVCAIAEKISNAIAEPIETQTGNLSIYGSIGIALAPKNGREIEMLIKKSDKAMYVSKTENIKYWCYQEQDNTVTEAKLF